MPRITRVHFVLLLIVFCVLMYCTRLILQDRGSTDKNWQNKTGRNLQQTNKEPQSDIKSSFVFYAGLESPGGNILISISHQQNTETLEKLCLSTKGCVGFTTSGSLKSRLLPFEKWVHLNSTNEGIYSLDVNHCNIYTADEDDALCPMDSFCTSLSNGRFTCEYSDIIQVVVSVDKNDSQGLVPLLQSLKTHHTKRLMVHVVTSTEEKEAMQRLVYCSLTMTDVFKVRIVGFNVPKETLEMIRIRRNGKQYLNSPANFARFYFDRILPSLEYVIYIDVDTIVKHDINELWERLLKTDKLMLAVERDRISHKLLPAVKELYRKRYNKAINMTKRGYNAGIFGLNLDKWRKKKLTDEVLYWMNLNKNKRLWHLGTQPIMHILSNDDWEKIDTRWNTDNLGSPEAWFKVANETIAEAYILHWNGPYKPWLETGKHVDLWKEYDTGMCHRRGTCLSRKGRVGVCQCDSGFQGDTCEKNATKT